MRIIWRICLILFSVVLILFGIFIAYNFIYTPSSNERILQNSGLIGDYIGGIVGTIFSLSGFLILFINLNDQRHEAFIERFESKFFEMVRFHRDNINELSLSVDEKSNIDSVDENVKEEIYSKRKVFKGIFDQFIQCRNEIKQNLNIHG